VEKSGGHKRKDSVKVRGSNLTPLTSGSKAGALLHSSRHRSLRPGGKGKQRIRLLR
jgi:hypothetical protein